MLEVPTVVILLTLHAFKHSNILCVARWTSVVSKEIFHFIFDQILMGSDKIYRLLTSKVSNRVVSI